ncbi:hypothetical protein BT93_A1543 [Corymbia citriodora subsp. variegata]|nr:hypothetical protein BT93_A1543 [Corymbia citriodora subsp. variegata]
MGLCHRVTEEFGASLRVKLPSSPRTSTVELDSDEDALRFVDQSGTRESLIITRLPPEIFSSVAYLSVTGLSLLVTQTTVCTLMGITWREEAELEVAAGGD